MELKEFVKQAIVDIAAGVGEAPKELTGGQTIASTGQAMLKQGHSSVAPDVFGHLYSVVDFDVAVTTLDEVRGDGGIQVFSIGAKGEAAGRAETASRIAPSHVTSSKRFICTGIA